MAGLFSKGGSVSKRPFCSAVVVAAGDSRRMGADKMSMIIGKKTVIAHTLTALEACECIDEIIIVCRQESIVDIARLCRDYGVIKATNVIAGGRTRLESALIGISASSPKAKLVAIHDGARPLVTEAVVAEAVECAAHFLAAAPAVAVCDTIKVTDKGDVVNTPSRETLMATQTPQVFETDLIKAALSTAFEKGEDYSDDCAAVEAFGVLPRLTAGSRENIKITTPLDIQIAEAILHGRGE